MHVARLRLTDFRSYRELDLALPRGLVVLRGRNAQGKSNVLEAVAIAATSRSFRTASERETVRWGALGHFARVEALVVRRADTLDVEVVISDVGTDAGIDGASSAATGARSGPAQRPAGAVAGEVTAGAQGGSSAIPALPTPPAAPFRKRIRVNGAPRRAMDLLGQVTVVVFAPTHLDLVTGPPGERRRFLDMTLCQVHPAYCRALSQYHKILTQRAALLKRIRDGEESGNALTYWDEQLARLALPLMRVRETFLARAELPAARLYAALAGEHTAVEEDRHRLYFQ